jgi:hypothetical protein
VEIIVKLLSIARKYKGVLFEPIAFPISEIERGNPFVREILETGKDIIKEKPMDITAKYSHNAFISFLSKRFLPEDFQKSK